MKGAALIGVDIGRFTILEPTQARANEARIEQWYVSPAIVRVFSLEAYADAMVAAFDGTGCGRVVVRMA